MIIAITGTNGAGKGAVVEHLIKSRGFYHASARQLLIKEIRKRKLPIDRDTMRQVADDLRLNREPKYGYVALALLEEAETNGKNAIIESVRALAEIALLREKDPDVKIWAVDADPAIRYDRVVNRKSHTDQVSYEQFLKQEALESHNAEPWRANLPACIKIADKVFMNNGTREKLEKQIEAALR